MSRDEEKRAAIDASLRAKIGSSRDPDVQYKTAFVIARKLREPMETRARSVRFPRAVDVAGGFFGGYRKPADQKEGRRRLAAIQNGKPPQHMP